MDRRASKGNASKKKSQSSFGEGDSLSGGILSRHTLLDGDPSAEQVHGLSYSFQPGASPSNPRQNGNGEGVRRQFSFLYGSQRYRCRGSRRRFTNSCESFVPVVMFRLHRRMVAREFTDVPCVRYTVFQP